MEGVGERARAPRASRTEADSGSTESARPAGSDSDAPVPGALLEVRGLRVSYPGAEVVHGVDLHVMPGEVVGLVGESGSGKTQTALSVLGLLPDGGRISAGTIRVGGERSSPRSAAARLGRQIAYIPQEPQTNLDPSFTIGHQLMEPLRVVSGLSASAARTRALELLRSVGIPDPERLMSSYPHQISGGMAQRVLIAGAISGDPDLIIADEPTTALDVTVQADILDVLRELQSRRGLAVLLVTHNFGVVADLCDRVYVMNGGRVVEDAPTGALHDSPQEEYTAMLLSHILEGGPSRAQLDADAAGVRS
jgi:peptide/nickel transport system permease protein